MREPCSLLFLSLIEWLSDDLSKLGRVGLGEGLTLFSQLPVPLEKESPRRRPSTVFPIRELGDESATGNLGPDNCGSDECAGQGTGIVERLV